MWLSEPPPLSRIMAISSSKGTFSRNHCAKCAKYCANSSVVTAPRLLTWTWASAHTDFRDFLLSCCLHNPAPRSHNFATFGAKKGSQTERMLLHLPSLCFLETTGAAGMSFAKMMSEQFCAQCHRTPDLVKQLAKNFALASWSFSTARQNLPFAGQPIDYMRNTWKNLYDGQADKTSQISKSSTRHLSMMSKND